MALVKLYDSQDETFLQSLIVPEEDRHLFISSTWSGGYRWFRSPDVVPIEHYQRINMPVQPIKRAG